jgi:SAM-dependent methyltransferase
MSVEQGIDPLGLAVDGVYRDPWVEVRAQRGAVPRRDLHTVRTPHFDVATGAARIQVTHRVPPDRVDDDLSGLLADELFTPGWLRGPDLFERIFTGVVLSTDPDPVEAWARFYRNTLLRVDASLDATRTGGAGAGGTGTTGHGTTGHGTIADYAPVYRHAEQALAAGDVLELGSCFGFLSLRIAQAGRHVTATDLEPGTVGLLGRVAPRLGLGVDTLVADAAHVPLPDGYADTVLAIHLLEHLDADHGARVLTEALRLARRRVVVAVPLEDVPDETWGHVRTVSLADLDRWGAATGHPYAVAEDHGGWLQVDLLPH